MKRILSAFVRVAFIACLMAFAAETSLAAAPAGVTQTATVEGITEYKLANGLTVVLFPDATKPVTTVNVTYKVGSRQENYGETGMAHLLEHMLFKGTPTHGNLMQELGKRGMTFNGSTYFDRTNYFESFPASDENLDWALAMEADRMVNSFVARKDLDTEMTVVRNEYERWENNPRQVLWGRMQSTAYDWHNYGHITIGARSDIENVNIERLQAYYHLYYQPDNAVLVVAGKFDPERTLGSIVKYFGAIPAPARALPVLYTTEPVQDGERSVTVRRVGGNKIVGMLFHTVPAAHPDATALDALADMMTVAPAGRLYKSLVESKKASSVQAWNIPLHDPGVIIFWATVPDADSLDEARATMAATLASVATQPFSETELERVRAKAMKDFDDTINDPQRLGVALSESIANGDWRLFFIGRDRWKKVTIQDVQRVASEYLKTSNLTTGYYIPDAKPDRAPTAPTVDVAAMVKDYKGEAATSAGEAFDPTPANLEARTQRFELANGIKVAFLPKKTRGETVELQLTMHLGDEKSVFGRRPEGSLAASMLMRGTRKHTRQQIEDALDALRAKLNVGGGETGVSATGHTVREKLPDTLRLLAEIMREPAFPASELEQIKRARLTSLQQQRSDPQSVAVRALQRHNNPYPPGDPRYATTVDEDIAALDAATIDKVQRFYQQFYGPARAEIALVGDFDPATMRTLLNELFGDWKPAAPFARVPQPFIPNKAADIRLETPDRANAVLIGNEALQLNDDSPDYPALLVASYMLGESSNSRLFNRLRQKEGLSYSVGDFLQMNAFEPNSALGLFAIFAPQNLERVRAGMREELARIVTQGFNEAEVVEARRGLLQERRLQRAHDGALVSGLTNQLYLGRTFRKSAEIDAAIEAMTADQVNAAVRKYVKPDELALAFAGDFAKAQAAAGAK
ncbi:MAG TPA: pitrilysin family protein [Casimicrobiaceae bacterium]|nr:pitrilysin family protein [Casimicrobiaceae bacterium]